MAVIKNENKALEDSGGVSPEVQRAWAEAKAKDYGITLTQPTATTQSTPTSIQSPIQPSPAPTQMSPTQMSPTPIQPQKNYNQSSDMNSLINWSQQMADSSFTSQKAQLDMALESQIAQLKMAYEQAVADGEISVRDAQVDFEAQKKVIQQQAYLDSERTGLYGQEMGIQNSQQMVGLMQGDNARNNSLINENMTTRDKRVSDIKTKLNEIKAKKNIDLAKAQADHGYGVIGARATADNQMAQNIFGVMKDEYGANRDQRFAQDNLRLGDELTRGQMNLQQWFNEKNIDTNFQNSLKAATHESTLAIERMGVQHGFDMKAMSQSLANDITKMAEQFGYNTQLNTQEQENKIELITKEYEAKVKAEEDAYKKQLAIDLKGIDPTSDEYKVLSAKREQEFKDAMTMLHVQTVYEANMQNIITNNPTSIPEKPKNYITDTMPGSNMDMFGGIMNFLTGFEGSNNAYLDAVKRRNEYDSMYNSVDKYMPWNYK